MTNKFYGVRKELNTAKNLVSGALQARDEALIDKIFAEEISKTFEQTVKNLKRQMKEDKERCKSEYELIFATC